MDMDDILSYTSTPMGSLVTQPPEKEEAYLDYFLDAPEGLSKMLLSRNTGSYLRGLAKQFGLDVKRTPEAALQVLRVAVGEVKLEDLAKTLAEELKIPSEKAVGMATEIEKELFGPVLLELNEFLKKQREEQS